MEKTLRTLFSNSLAEASQPNPAKRAQTFLSIRRLQHRFYLELFTFGNRTPTWALKNKAACLCGFALLGQRQSGTKVHTPLTLSGLQGALWAWKGTPTVVSLLLMTWEFQRGVNVCIHMCGGALVYILTTSMFPLPPSAPGAVNQDLGQCTAGP